MEYTLYNFLTSMVSITTDVVVLVRVKPPCRHNYDLLTRHSRRANVKDDLPEEYWDLKVCTIAVLDDYPGELVVFVE